MTRVDLDVQTWLVREAEDDGWDNGDFDGSVGAPMIIPSSDKYHHTYRGKDTELEPPFWVIYCGYVTGNTFGTDYDGEILAIVKDEDEALELYYLFKAEKGFGFEYKGEHYSVPWNGFFESLGSLDMVRLS